MMYNSENKHTSKIKKTQEVVLVTYYIFKKETNNEHVHGLEGWIWKEEKYNKLYYDIINRKKNMPTSESREIQVDKVSSGISSSDLFSVTVNM